MGASPKTKILLAYRSGDRCAFPECGKSLTYEDIDNDVLSNVGEAAHIAGEHENSARYDHNMTDEQTNHYHNLVFLCREHHKVIDDNETVYTVDKLKSMKHEHERKVRVAVNAALAEVGFPELEQATQWIKQIPPELVTQDYSIIPPEEKIKKNDLTNESRVTITMGLGVAKEVHSFIESEVNFDIDFPERLKTGFLKKYYQLYSEGHRGDELFDLMCQFAQQGMDVQAKRSAGLAVLIYLFERCEVFEK